ncbi:serine-rich adhesin for platelets-like [Microplitis mediator]|uniref:serine-rich adhesin for platelets-like n=1 Tax=Microplitis mediator TaxID=375433 RepID=UPI0025537D62|nr:serine-rich adhesin for platelets-like [Microplitis mediator]
MCDQTEIKYEDEEVVWVKLGACWWPGQVTGYEKLPEDIKIEFDKKGLIAAVKFFQEDKFEYVKNLQQIYKYNCKKKDDFIKKGFDKYRSKTKEGSSYMDKFPQDIVMAEKLTNGDPNILRTPKFSPEEKPDISYLFGGDKKVSKKKKDKDDRKSFSAISPERKITHPRFRGPSDHEIRIRANQYSSSSQPSTPDEKIPSYNCPLCSFTSTRVNVLISHNRSHRSTGWESPLSRSRTSLTPKTSRPHTTESPKRKYVRKTKSLSAKSPVHNEKLSTSETVKRKYNKNTDNKVIKKKKTDPELREKLLADWDIDSSDEDFGNSLNKSESFDDSPSKNTTINVSDNNKNNNYDDHNNDLLMETDKLLKDTQPNDLKKGIEDKLKDHNDDADNKVEKDDENNLNKILHDQENESKDKKNDFKEQNKDKDKSKFSCFDFDEDEPEPPVTIPVRKLGRVFGDKTSLKKEIIKEFTKSQALENKRDEINKVVTDDDSKLIEEMNKTVDDVDNLMAKITETTSATKSTSFKSDLVAFDGDGDGDDDDDDDEAKAKAKAISSRSAASDTLILGSESDLKSNASDTLLLGSDSDLKSEASGLSELGPITSELGSVASESQDSASKSMGLDSDKTELNINLVSDQVNQVETAMEVDNKEEELEIVEIIETEEDEEEEEDAKKIEKEAINETPLSIASQSPKKSLLIPKSPEKKSIVSCMPDMDPGRVTIEEEEETLPISQLSRTSSRVTESGSLCNMGWSQLSEIIGSTPASKSVDKNQSSTTTPMKRGRGRPPKNPKIDSTPKLNRKSAVITNSLIKIDDQPGTPGTPESFDERKTSLSESDTDRSHTGRRRKPNKKYLEDAYSSPGSSSGFAVKTDDSQSETEEKKAKMVKKKRGRPLGWKKNKNNREVKPIEEYEMSDQTIDSAEEIVSESIEVTQVEERIIDAVDNCKSLKVMEDIKDVKNIKDIKDDDCIIKNDKSPVHLTNLTSAIEIPSPIIEIPLVASSIDALTTTSGNISGHSVEVDIDIDDQIGPVAPEAVPVNVNVDVNADVDVDYEARKQDEVDRAALMNDLEDKDDDDDNDNDNDTNADNNAGNTHERIDILPPKKSQIKKFELSQIDESQIDLENEIKKHVDDVNEIKESEEPIQVEEEKVEKQNNDIEMEMEIEEEKTDIITDTFEIVDKIDENSQVCQSETIDTVENIVQNKAEDKVCEEIEQVTEVIINEENKIQDDKIQTTEDIETEVVDNTCKSIDSTLELVDKALELNDKTCESIDTVESITQVIEPVDSVESRTQVVEPVDTVESITQVNEPVDTVESITQVIEPVDHKSSEPIDNNTLELIDNATESVEKTSESIDKKLDLIDETELDSELMNKESSEITTVIDNDKSLEIINKPTDNESIDLLAGNKIIINESLKTDNEVIESVDIPSESIQVKSESIDKVSEFIETPAEIEAKSVVSPSTLSTPLLTGESLESTIPVKKREKPRIIENVQLKEPMHILKSKLLEKPKGKHKLIDDDNKTGSKAKIIKLDPSIKRSKSSGIMSYGQKIKVLKAADANDRKIQELSQITTSSVINQRVDETVRTVETIAVVAEGENEKLIQQSSASLEDMDLDINSIPFVMSEDLTPDSIEQMPVVISSIIPTSNSEISTQDLNIPCTTSSTVEFGIGSTGSISSPVTPSVVLDSSTVSLSSSSESGAIVSVPVSGINKISQTLVSTSTITLPRAAPALAPITPSSDIETITVDASPKKKCPTSPAILKTKPKAKPTITSIKTISPPITAGGIKSIKFQNTKSPTAMASKHSASKYVIVQAGAGGQQMRYMIHGKPRLGTKTVVSAGKPAANPQIVSQGGKVVILTSPQSGQAKMVPLKNSLGVIKGQQTYAGTSKTNKIDTPTTSKLSSPKLVSSNLLTSKPSLTPMTSPKTIINPTIIKGGVFTSITPKIINQKLKPGTLISGSPKTILTSIPGKIVTGSMVPGKGTVLTPITGQQVKAIAAKSPAKPGQTTSKVTYQLQKGGLPMVTKTQKIVSMSSTSSAASSPLKSLKPTNIVMTQKNRLPKKIIRQAGVVNQLPVVANPVNSSSSNLSPSPSSSSSFQGIDKMGKLPRGRGRTKIQPESPGIKLKSSPKPMKTPPKIKSKELVTGASSASVSGVAFPSTSLGSPSGSVTQIETALSVPVNAPTPGLVTPALKTATADAAELQKLTSVLEVKEEKPVPQIMALPTESSDGTQTYVLVTIDDQGQIQPLDNNALMSLEGTTQNPDGTRTLYIDPASLGEAGNLDNIVLQFDNSMAPASSISSAPIPTLATSDYTRSQVPTTNQDILAAALANTDFQQDILPETTASLTSGLTSTSLINQTILQSTIIPTSDPISSPSVLETSLTLNQPIMTPLEVPSSLSIQVNASETLNTLAHPVVPIVDTGAQTLQELPITINNPTIEYINSKLPGNSMPDIEEIDTPVSAPVVSSADNYLVIPSISDSGTVSYAVSIPDNISIDSTAPTPSMPIIDDGFNDNQVQVQDTHTFKQSTQVINEDDKHAVRDMPIVADETCTPMEVDVTETVKQQVDEIDNQAQQVENVNDQVEIEVSQVKDQVTEIQNQVSEIQEQISEIQEQVSEIQMHGEIIEEIVNNQVPTIQDVQQIQDHDIQEQVHIHDHIEQVQELQDIQVEVNQDQNQNQDNISEIQDKIFIQEQNQDVQMQEINNKPESTEVESMEVQESEPSQSYEPSIEIPTQSKLQSTEASPITYEAMIDDSEPPTQSYDDIKAEATQSYDNAPTQSFTEDQDTRIDDPSFPTQSYEVEKPDNNVDVDGIIETDGELSQEGNIPSQSNDIDRIGTCFMSNDRNCGNIGVASGASASSASGFNEDETASSSYVPETPETQERDQDQESAISTSSYEIPTCEEINIASSSVIPDTSVDAEHISIHNNGVPEIPTSSYNLNPDSSSGGSVDAVPSSSYEDNQIERGVVEQNVSTSYQVSISMPGLEGNASFVSESTDQVDQPSSYYTPHTEDTSEATQSYFVPEGPSPSYQPQIASPSYYEPPPESEATQSYYSQDNDQRTRDIEQQSASQSYYQESTTSSSTALASASTSSSSSSTSSRVAVVGVGVGAGVGVAGTTTNDEELRLGQVGEATPTYSTERYPVDYHIDNSSLIDRHDLVESSVSATPQPTER